MKRIFSAILVCAVLLSCCTSAFAATESGERVADILNVYTASASTGTKSGEVKITYRAGANRLSMAIGVASIAIYKSDGSYVTTIKGTTANGLISFNTDQKSGSYTYKGTSGVFYYAIVTITATSGSETDNKAVRTNIAQAK